MKNPYSLKNILLSEGIIKDILNENVRFDFQKGGGGGKRFIPTNGIVPSKLFTALPNHFKMLGDQLLISPEAVIALTSVERGRGGAVNYKELYNKLRGYFDIKKANSSSEFGPAQTSSFLSQFKQGLKGRLDSMVSGGKEFKAWNGEGSKDEKGDFVFPLAQFKADSLQEDEKKFDSARIVNKNDFDKFIKSNPALGTIYDEDTNKFKVYLYADLVAYFDPKYGRIDYTKDSRFAKISDEYKWDRNIN